MPQDDVEHKFGNPGHVYLKSQNRRALEAIGFRDQGAKGLPGQKIDKQE